MIGLDWVGMRMIGWFIGMHSAYTAKGQHERE